MCTQPDVISLVWKNAVIAIFNLVFWALWNECNWRIVEKFLFPAYLMDLNKLAKWFGRIIYWSGHKNVCTFSCPGIKSDGEEVGDSRFDAKAYERCKWPFDEPVNKQWGSGMAKSEVPPQTNRLYLPPPKISRCPLNLKKRGIIIQLRGLKLVNNSMTSFKFDWS